MCVASMIYDYFDSKWQRDFMPVVWLPANLNGIVFPDAMIPAPFPVGQPNNKELEEFSDLLARARQYDKDKGEPDCELEEKKSRLEATARYLNLDLQYLAFLQLLDAKKEDTKDVG